MFGLGNNKPIEDDDGSNDLYTPLSSPLHTEGEQEEYAGQLYDRASRLSPPDGLHDHETDTRTQHHITRGGLDPRSLHLRIASACHRRTSTLLIITLILLLLILLPMLILHAVKDYKSGRTDFAAFYSAFSFVLATLVLSTREIYKHLRHWYMPDVQKYVVRILWMVPLYAIQSWLSLRFHNARIYIDTIRDLYEAFVIQSFVYYLVELLGGEERLTVSLRNRDAHLGEHGYVLGKCLRSWEMGAEFLAQCKWGVLQYVVIKTVATLLTAVLEPLGMYGEGSFDFRKGYVYLSFVLNCSVMYALYCLVKLFHATRDDLTNPVNWHPIGKFLCVKGVVFFTWWQGVLIFFLKEHGFIANMGNWDADDIAYALQDYLICVEMFFFAIAHSFTFTYTEYLPSGLSSQQNGMRGLDGRGRGGQRQGWGTDGIRGGSGLYNGLPQGDSKNISGALNTTNDEDDGDEEYQPPVIRTLHAPMGFRDALWSSTIPDETISDIRRLGNGVSDKVRDEATDAGMISMSCLQHAESI